MSTHELLGKRIRGRFGFPSGVVATNTDIARWMLVRIPQIGFYVGKSTTIEPRSGNPEDIIAQSSHGSLWNAVGYANPGLDETARAFATLKEAVPEGVFLMPQIGEGNEERFAHCAAVFDRLGDAIDGLELNLSCPHAERGGIQIGSSPESVHSIVSAVRKATRKPLITKLNAGVIDLESVAHAAVSAGADAISAINTLGSDAPELSNAYGGLSGTHLFPVTCDAVGRLSACVQVPLIAMGGIRGASDVRRLERICSDLYFGIGTALTGMDSEMIVEYFAALDRDLDVGTDLSTEMVRSSWAANHQPHGYQPFIVESVEQLTETLRLVRFREHLHAETGQFVFLKIANRHAKPFSVANDSGTLELVIRRVGEFTTRAFTLKENDVVRIRGPYGRPILFPPDRMVVFVGAGCGIAPIHHAATHHRGPRRFVVGAKTRREIVYLDEMEKMGQVSVATEDGSIGHRGVISELLSQTLEGIGDRKMIFFNCGPEIVLREAGRIERQYTHPSQIYHLVERMTKCGIGVCGSCAIPSGKRLCVDGPWFDAEEFSPALYTRDSTGKKILFE